MKNNICLKNSSKIFILTTVMQNKFKFKSFLYVLLLTYYGIVLSIPRGSNTDHNVDLIDFIQASQDYWRELSKGMLSFNDVHFCGSRFMGLYSMEGLKITRGNKKP